MTQMFLLGSTSKLKKFVQLSRVAILCLVPLLVSCSSVFYQPDRYMYFPPELNGFKQENVYFQSPDGVRLHGWYIRTNRAKPLGTVVQFHGNAENISSHYASLAWLTRQGYNLFTFDYRGYGESFGEPNQKGVYQDSLAALDKAWDLHKASKGENFIVYGESLGGAVAMRGFIDFRHQVETALIVMDSTFMSYKDVAQQTLAKVWLTWPISPLARVLVSDKYASSEAVSRLRTRLLVIHDKRDPVVQYKNGREIFERAKTEKDFWELDRGRHISTFTQDRPENRVRFLKLLSSI